MLSHRVSVRQGAVPGSALCVEDAQRRAVAPALPPAPLGYAPGRAGKPIRMAEIQTLFAQVPDADVVMGDFNSTPESPVL